MAESECFHAQWILAFARQDLEMCQRCYQKTFKSDGHVTGWYLHLSQPGDDVVMLHLSTKRFGSGSAGLPLCSVAYARDRGWLDLMCAITLNDEELFEERLRRDDVNGHRGPLSETPLSLALEQDRPAMVRRLLESGADPNATTRLGPLVWLCRSTQSLMWLCIFGLRPSACRCRKRTVDPSVVPFLLQAGFRPCAHAECLLRKGAVLSLERQCSNRIRRNRVDTSDLPRVLADGIWSFGI